MKKYLVFISIILLFLLLTTTVYAELLDLSLWTPYTANGSEVKLLSPHEALFKVIRKNNGPKWDPTTHGYAFLISDAISIDKDWTKIVIEGTWWREDGPKNYQEMNLVVFAKKPPYPFKRVKKEGKLYTNYIAVSYVSWYKVIDFSDMGATKDTRTHRDIRRKIPLSPTRFRLVIFRQGEVWWEYWEQNPDKSWEKLHEQEVSFLFDGLKYPFDKLYLKIGGWTSWEKPIMSKLHFKDLGIKIFK